ncbi:MAG: response regulator [Candidatus Latescibacterota bacterium]
MHTKYSILVVDDEKNIRLTLVQALEALDLEIDTAINGEEALSKLKERFFKIILLDLKLPGMDGMEVLRRVRKMYPECRVVIISAHGTIESAVEALKLGAVDFIEKPFVPKEIRELVSKVIEREKISDQNTDSYTTLIELAKKSIWEGDTVSSFEFSRKAISLDPYRPEGFNFLGALEEMSGNMIDAQKHYRTALSLDPTYEPARKNLSRATSWEKKGNIILGSFEKEEE